MADEPIKSGDEMITGIDIGIGDDRTVVTLPIDVDCSDALKGLKAVTREAKKATVALKEFEEMQKNVERISIMNIGPGDTLVIKANQELSHEHVTYIKDTIRKETAIDDNVHILVLSDGVDIGILKKDIESTNVCYECGYMRRGSNVSLAGTICPECGGVTAMMDYAK